VVTLAYDERGRVIFKSHRNEDTGVEGQTFYYWDQWDRLSAVKRTPDITDSDTYSEYWPLWVNGRVVYTRLRTFVDGVNTATDRRFWSNDEQGRMYKSTSWPTSGDAEVKYTAELGTHGWDIPLSETTWFHPFGLRACCVSMARRATRSTGATIW